VSQVVAYVPAVRRLGQVMLLYGDASRRPLELSQYYEQLYSKGRLVYTASTNCQNGTYRLQGDTASSTCLATINETMPSTEAPASDIARRRESRPGYQGRLTLLMCLG
jgi:hypothetical protein